MLVRDERFDRFARTRSSVRAWLRAHCEQKGSVMKLSSLVLAPLTLVLIFACNTATGRTTARTQDLATTDEVAVAKPTCDDDDAIWECDGDFSDADCKGKNYEDACTWGGGRPGTCGATYCWLVGEKGGAAVCKCDCPCFADPATDRTDVVTD